MNTRFASVLFVAAVVCICMSGCGGSSEGDSNQYDVQTVIIPGVMTPMYQITDHESDTLFIYRLEKEKLVLLHTIDLKNTGRPEMPIISADKK